MDKELFIKVCDDVIGQRQGMNGIGTLGEKTVHSVLKSYYSPDPINHEIKVGGFVADICTGSEIIEIQTRNFDKLRRKLTAFLSFAPVTIVYPIHNIKWLRWVNPQTGEISPPRKSPKPGSPYTIFPELYRIKEFLNNPNLNLKIVMINLEEYRFLDGWSQDKKKGSSRCDRIPTELVSEITINSLGDYEHLIPTSLSLEFTSKDYKKASGLPLHHAQTALHILHYIGVLDRVGKKGNSFIYARAGEGNTTIKSNNSSENNTEKLEYLNTKNIGKAKKVKKQDLIVSENNIQEKKSTSKRTKSKSINIPLEKNISEKNSRKKNTVEKMKSSKQNMNS